MRFQPTPDLWVKSKLVLGSTLDLLIQHSLEHPQCARRPAAETSRNSQGQTDVVKAPAAYPQSCSSLGMHKGGFLPAGSILTKAHIISRSTECKVYTQEPHMEETSASSWKEKPGKCRKWNEPKQKVTDGSLHFELNHTATLGGKVGLTDQKGRRRNKISLSNGTIGGPWTN